MQREQWIQYFNNNLVDGIYTDVEETRIRRLLSDLDKNGRLDLPRVLLAGLSLNDSRQPYLTVVFWDETRQVEGLFIEEFNRNDSSTVSECYELGVGGAAGGLCDAFVVPVTIRDAGQRKNTEEWNRFMGLEVKTKEAMPTIWISLPTESLQVVVGLIDSSGSKISEGIPFRIKPLSSPKTSSGRSSGNGKS